jgi:hypothetical protein
VKTDLRYDSPSAVKACRCCIKSHEFTATGLGTSLSVSNTAGSCTFLFMMRNEAEIYIKTNYVRAK